MFSAAMLFARVSGLLKRVPWQAWAALALIAAVLFYGHHREAQGYAEGKAKMQPIVDAANENHRQTKANFRAAQDEAAKMQAAVVAAEKARQERITDEVRKDYQQRLAAIRARADRVRTEAGTSAGSAPGQVRMPALAEAPRRADGTPDCNAVFAGYVAGQFPPLETRIQCAERAEKEALDHDALITWLLGLESGK